MATPLGTIRFWGMKIHVFADFCRFYALWDDRGNEFGEVAHYKVHYYLIDDTVEIMQIKNKFKQNEPFTRLLRRTRLPKNYAPGNGNMTRVL